MKEFDRTSKQVMIRMFRLMQAICIIYCARTRQTEYDTTDLSQWMFKISHIIVDPTKQNHSNWVQEVLDLEAGFIESKLLEKIDEIYKDFWKESL